MVTLVMDVWIIKKLHTVTWSMLSVVFAYLNY